MILLLNVMVIAIVVSIVVFSALIIIMTWGLLFARKRLVPQGDVQISINGGAKVLNVKPGTSLLGALSGESVFLPSACGGGGTCAMCKCQVLDGGGDVLPTEMNHLSRKEAADKWRLACQVKVRGNMDVKVPEEIFGIKKWECEVVSNWNVATFIKEFVVKLPEGEVLDFEPGGYIQIDVPVIDVDFKDMDIRPLPNDPSGPEKYKSEWDTYDLWSLKMRNPEPQFRAYSMANHPAEGNIIMLNIRIATPPFKPFKEVKGEDGKVRREFDGYVEGINPGVCSSYVFSRKKGDKVMISGPYGEFHIKPTNKEMVYIGGGAGMAPLRSHLYHLLHTEKTRHRKISFWYGGRTRRELFYIDEFRALEREFDNFKFYVVLDNPLPEDNWKVKKDIADTDGEGFRGYVMPVLVEQYLKNHPEPEEIEYYFCGPPMMNQSVLKALDSLGVPPENISFDDFGG